MSEVLLEVPKDVANTIVDPAAHANTDRLHAAMQWLRTHEPLAKVHPDGYTPFWVASKYEDIKWFGLQSDLFHSGDRNITLISDEEARMMQELTGRDAYLRQIVNMDAPDHPKYRKVAESFFTRQSLLRLEEDIRGIAREFVGRLAKMGGACDFANDIAFIYPLRVIMALLGLPVEDESEVLGLTKELMGVADPAHNRTGAEIAAAFLSVCNRFDTYLRKVLDDRRANPRDDFASVIASAEIDGKPLPDLEAINYCQVVATAGHDTTAASTAGGMRVLCENPALLKRLQAEPSLIGNFVAESTRWVSPSKITMRSAVRDVEYKGHQIKAGESLGLAWVSANRDESVFEDPFTFNIDRPPFKLLSFGWGPHNCIGQHLARMEMRVLFEELIPALAEVELAGTPKSMASLMVSGPKYVPIRYKLSPRVDA